MKRAQHNTSSTGGANQVQDRGGGGCGEQIEGGGWFHKDKVRTHKRWLAAMLDFLDAGVGYFMVNKNLSE